MWVKDRQARLGFNLPTLFAKTIVALNLTGVATKSARIVAKTIPFSGKS